MSNDQDFRRKHPSYGLLNISRIHGGTGELRLFGSPLARHYGTIRMSIGNAEWLHELHRDRYYGSLRGELIEIEMSAAQFADAITSLNMGGGTPCTIRYVDGKRIDDPPDYATEAEHIRDNFEDTLQKYTSFASEYADKIKALTAKLPAKARREIEIALEVIQAQLASNVPFVLKQFQEATTKITTSAKAEVEAFVSNTVRAAGIKAISEGGMPSLLPEPKPDWPSEPIHHGACDACVLDGHPECTNVHGNVIYRKPNP